MPDATKDHDGPDPTEVPLTDQAVQVTPWRTIGVGELMVVIAFVGVILAVARWNLGVGITSAALLSTALTWWLQLMAQRKAEGRLTTPGKRMVLLLKAIAGVFLLSGIFVLLSIVITRLVVWVVNILHNNLGDRVTAAVGVLAVVVYVASRLWQHRRSKPGVDP